MMLFWLGLACTETKNRLANVQEGDQIRFALEMQVVRVLKGRSK